MLELKNAPLTLFSCLLQLTEVETNFEQLAVVPTEILGALDLKCAGLRSWDSLVLGCSSQVLQFQVKASPEMVTMAARRNPHLRYLQLYTASMKAVENIKFFHEVIVPLKGIQTIFFSRRAPETFVYLLSSKVLTGIAWR